MSAKEGIVGSEERLVRSRVAKVRRVVLPVTFLLFVVGVVVAGGLGDACSVGYGAIAAICPLGALESFFGSWSFLPRMAIGVGFGAVVVLVVGKAFCSWVCPVPPLSRFLSSKKRRRQEADERRSVAEHSLAAWKSAKCDCESGRCVGCAAAVPKGVSTPYLRKGLNLDSRHAVLAGALATTAVCGFPVFCLVCPVGLTFATVIALYRFVGFSEPTIDLLVFPAIIAIELVLLRKWCHQFCPIGALMSLLSPLAKKLRPRVAPAACLRSKGSDCTVCASVCPEGIDPVGDLGARPLSECTRCGRCAEACPAGALSFREKLRTNDGSLSSLDELAIE